MIHHRLAVVVAAAAAGLVVAACSSTIAIDTAKLEDQLRQDIPAASLAPLVERVDCPDSNDVKVEQGATFECTLVIEGAPVRIKVTQDDAKGNVTYERLDAILDLATLRDEVAKAYADQVGVEVEVDCGTGTVRVAAVSSTLSCTVTAPSGETSDVTIQVNDVEGNVSIEG